MFSFTSQYKNPLRLLLARVLPPSDNTVIYLNKQFSVTETQRVSAVLPPLPQINQ